MKRTLFVCLVALIYFSSRSISLAVEGGLGKPISGAAINPFAGVVPPEPGLAVTVAEEYYDASIGGATTVPIANLLTLGIDSKVSFTLVEPLYIWPTAFKQWNFASALGIPITWLEVKAAVTVGPITRQVKDSQTGIFDLVFVPVIASYHISKTDHVAFSLTVWAPTGSYETGRLANLSTNTWTLIPGVAYTKIWAQPNIEFSGSWALTFDTENNATDYQNGILSDLEATLIKRFKCGLGIGVVGSWIEQLNDDGGPTADRLNGFSGRAFGVGPILTYSTKVGKSDLSFTTRYVHEFDNKKRMEGDLFTFSAMLKF